MSTSEANVESLIAKAAKAETADDAMKFAQAACNAANAMCGLIGAKRSGK